MIANARFRAIFAVRKSIRRLRRDRDGIAAVEFALILPLMIALYVGSTEVTQGVLASRKLAILSRTLSDIVAQQPTATTSPCTTAGLCNSAMTSIFGAASAIMSPFSTAYLNDGTTKALSMVVSSVEFVSDTNVADAAITANSYKAMVRWSKSATSPNDGTVRSCTTALTPVANTVSPALANLPSGLYSSGGIIIADVTYKYDPSFGGATLAWVNSSGATYVSMSNTTYMRPRNWTTYITYSSTEVTGTSCTG